MRGVGVEELDAVQGIQLRSVASLLRDVAGTNVLGEVTWDRVRQGLREESRAVLPGLFPLSSETVVMVFKLTDGEFGRLLEAARETVETGTQQAAEGLAEAARSLSALTSAPRQRHYRASAPPTDSSPRARLDHRVGMEGDGYLAMPATEALGALELDGRAPRPRDGVFPLPPYAVPGAWVVVRRGVHSAPGIVLTGIQAAYDHREGIGVEHLMSGLRTAAAALRPGPARIEWGT
jgi:hypothetical protein